ncbi:MAG: radical SAM protein [Clostridia bacterium]|nr:radical SAM protein [Clostridia bacterium]
MYAKVYVEITNICNMNCSFCHGHHRSPRRMSREEFSRILDALSGVTEYIYYHLMGEPLTHPELPEFIRMAASRGFKSIVTTNGTLLSARGEALLSAGPHKVNISLHSFEEGSEQDFVRYIDGVAEFAARAADGGVIVSLRLWNRNFDGGRNGRIEDMLRERLPGDWAENTRGIRIREKLHLEWGERFAWPDSDAPLQGESVFCYGLRDHFGILCDGTVVPCCLDSEGGIALGNIFTGEIGEILASPRAEAMRRGFSCRKASEELCRRCGYARRFTK